MSDRPTRGGAGGRAVVPLALFALVVSVAAGSVGVPSAAAATDNGAASIVEPGGGNRPLRRGGSSTAFNLRLGAGPVCPGDSASGNFRVQSFMVPSSVDPNSLIFDASGPVPFGGQFRQPLFDVTSSPLVNALTDVAVPPATTGGISGLPTFDFAVFSPGDVPAGNYAIGIACTLGPAGPDQLRTFWSTDIVVSASEEDRPAGLTWRTAAAGPTNGPGPAADPAAAGAGGAPTTTVDPGGASTTAAPATSTTSAPDDGAFAASAPSEPSVTATVGQLPLTGSSPWYRVAWGLALLVIGRMLYLVVRRPKVRAPRDG